MILDKIVAEKKIEVEQIKKPRNSLISKLTEETITLIAEIKKASPSKGIIKPDFDPVLQLKAYLKGGTDAISILTDKKFFQGSKEILRRLRKKTRLPILRKDFIIDSLQVYESFFLGADVILLIAAILEEVKLRNLLDTAHSLGMEALVEVHNLNDLKKALTSGARIIGINNRDLQDFTVELSTTERIVNELVRMNLKDKYYLVSESGIKTRNDIEYLKKLGINGVLIGESLMRAEDPVAKIKELFSCK
ncbi:MAG: indole-3-glycerol phosphate synthase [Halanaerobiales bacterium]|nr:indole-3-glycerol phosphate synthase [Halanaerobiales bacterium]